MLLQSFDLFSVCSECFFLYFSSIIHLNGKLFISCMLYLLYPSVIEFIFFIVNKQTTSIPRTFEKLATPLDAGPGEGETSSSGVRLGLVSGCPSSRGFFTKEFKQGTLQHIAS